MIKVSVIIPCYNTGKYICECLDSILSQTLNEIEIICIDDGSTDGTLNILYKYQKNNENIHILTQQNQGSGIARNQGISAASGEYLAFMDADDFYPSTDTLEKEYSTAKEKRAEICGGSVCVFRNGIYTYNGLRKGYVFFEDGWINKEEFPAMGTFWRFIYRKDFIIRNGIYFPDYLRCQDFPFLMNAIACAGRIYCMKEVTYVYRKEHKQVFFTQQKALDYARGMLDGLIIAKRERMLIIYYQVLNELQGELSALLYLYGEKNDEIRHIIHQFNEIIAEGIKDEIKVPLLKEGEGITQYIESVQKEIHSLLEELKKEKTVLIYGAGTVGKKVKVFLEENHVAIESFVVSDVRQNAASLDGLQIRCIDAYVDRKNDCMVILATFPYLHDEIKKTLQEKEFKKVYTLSLEKMHLFCGEVMH